MCTSWLTNQMISFILLFGFLCQSFWHPDRYPDGWELKNSNVQHVHQTTLASVSPSLVHWCTYFSETWVWNIDDQYRYSNANTEIFLLGNQLLRHAIKCLYNEPFCAPLRLVPSKVASKETELFGLNCLTIVKFVYYLGGWCLWW